MRIFFAGPLTHLNQPEEAKSFYKKMARVATDNGFEAFWAFLHGTDPVKDPFADPEYIYFKDLENLEKSNLMIAYVGEPSPGTGQELEYAHEHNIPVYLLYGKDQHVSRMIIGNPAVKGSIEFTNHDDALKKLDQLLKTINSRVS